jgi:two-component system sensor histidine kinase BaeS
MVELAVSDSGPGIEPEHLPYIFERFYRADQARSQHDGGSGLGLAIVKSIAEALGGSVLAESTPGGGATIRVRLPPAQ